MIEANPRGFAFVVLYYCEIEPPGVRYKANNASNRVVIT